MESEGRSRAIEIGPATRHLPSTSSIRTLRRLSVPKPVMKNVSSHNVSHKVGASSKQHNLTITFTSDAPPLHCQHGRDGRHHENRSDGFRAAHHVPISFHRSPSPMADCSGPGSERKPAADFLLRRHVCNPI